MMGRENRKEISECMRCGTCCRKGGPAFHLDDMRLIEDGTISATDLCTIREGEPVYDNVKGVRYPSPSDIIRLKQKNGSAACPLFREEDRECSIYRLRPVECRTLQCWNTAGIEALYAVERLTRRDLLSGMKEIWEAVSDHQKKCDYGRILQLSKSTAISPEVAEMVRFDVYLRELMVEKGGVDPDLLEFLFGKPLTEILQRCGIHLEFISAGAGSNG
jgi:Fe-S-cluster containining protein